MLLHLGPFITFRPSITLVYWLWPISNVLKSNPINFFYNSSLRCALFSLQRKCRDYVVIRSNILNAISGLHRHHEQIRFYAQKSWPADSNLRMNIRLKSLALLETEETAPTPTFAVKAQKILSSLFYLDPWMAVSWHKSCTRLYVIPSQVDANPVANHPRRRKSESLCAKYSRQKKKKID